MKGISIRKPVEAPFLYFNFDKEALHAWLYSFGDVLSMPIERECFIVRNGKNDYSTYSPREFFEIFNIKDNV